jgi:hypothetical protein
MVLPYFWITDKRFGTCNKFLFFFPLMNASDFILRLITSENLNIRTIKFIMNSITGIMRSVV